MVRVFSKVRSFGMPAGVGVAASVAMAAVLGWGMTARSSDKVEALTPTQAHNMTGTLMGAGPEKEKVLTRYCVGCHNSLEAEAGFSVEDLKASDLAEGKNSGAWEKVLRKVSLGEMPPKEAKQIGADEAASFLAWLDASRTAYAAANPDPGRATLRRMNRVEYANAVRDLLAFEVDVSGELPPDNSGYGFDNIADVLTVSPTLMDRYISVAGKISRVATGQASMRPSVVTYHVPKDASLKNQGIPSHNERSSDLLPVDSRGGGAFEFYAPHDAVYEIRGYLNANTNTELDRTPDNLYKIRTPLKAGRHVIGMAFEKQLALDESVQEVRNTVDIIVWPKEPPRTMKLNFLVDGARVGQTAVPSYQLSPRYTQTNFLRDVLQIEVEGPYEVQGPGDTAAREKIFVCRPYRAMTEEKCVRKIVTTLATRAYRRPVDKSDVDPLLRVYDRARATTDFDRGIEAVVQAVLVSPKFLFLHENDPKGAAPGTIHKISDLELASRLSFFLWSSIPDDELLEVAAKNRLSKPKVLEAQIERMLADPKAFALTENFASQWLYLRNLEQQRPDIVIYPQFDTRLRQAMKTETELFFASVIKENRSVLDFIDSDYTFLNERLARHYGIEGVRGAGFRRVALDPDSARGGLLGQGSILTVTSYGNHTSVVKRGQWIMENMLAQAPPPPPPNVPDLKEMHNGRQLSAREQMELHRADPACAGCHKMMDPLGFALENYDAIGGWRTKDGLLPIDTDAALPDGTKFSGRKGLTDVLMSRRGQFVDAFTQRLMTYALARGLEPEDMPTVRRIAIASAQDNYRVHGIIADIVQSTAFSMRKVKAPPAAETRNAANRSRQPAA